MSVYVPPFWIIAHNYIQVGEHEFKLRLLRLDCCPGGCYVWTDLEAFDPNNLEGNTIINEYMIENDMVDDKLYQEWYKALPKDCTPHFE